MVAMKQFKTWFFIAVAALGMASCSVDKRVYRKGYHVEWLGQKHTAKTQVEKEELADANVAEPLESDAQSVTSTVESETAPVAIDAPTPPVVEDAHTKKATEKRASKKSRAEVKEPTHEVWSGQRATPQEVTGAENAATETDLIVCVIIAFLLPPLGVYLFYDKINKDFWITLILTILVPYFGGLIYALYVMLFK